MNAPVVGQIFYYVCASDHSSSLSTVLKERGQTALHFGNCIKQRFPIGPLKRVPACANN